MKKRYLILMFLVTSFILKAQFNIIGELKNYKEKPVVIRVYQNGLDKFLAKISTDNSGRFNYKVPFMYKGVVQLELTKGRYQLISDNTDINFVVDATNPLAKIKFASGPNKTLADYNNYQSYLNIKNKTILPLQTFYKPNEPFYKALEQEKSRIEAMKPISIKNTDLEYYLKMQKTLEQYENKQMAPLQIKADAKNHLVKDDLNLENYGFLPELVVQYLSNSIQGARNREEARLMLRSSIDVLLDSVGEETARGQSVLLTVINLLRSSNFKGLVKDYTDKAEALTCEINPSLKSMLKNKDNVAVGKKVPNIVFEEKIKGAKSLYDIKANKKLLIFWGSWCGHCQHEWPFIKAFYPEFKKQGGEIITFAVDLEKQNILPFINGTDWYNYSDFLKWDSPIIKEYGITGTPTMILLDKDNKVIKTGSRVAEFSNFK